MLLLTRRVNDRILIGDDIEVTVCKIEPHQVRIGIEAPKEVSIVRSEAKVKERKEEP